MKHLVKNLTASSGSLLLITMSVLFFCTGAASAQSCRLSCDDANASCTTGAAQDLAICIGGVAAGQAACLFVVNFEYDRCVEACDTTGQSGSALAWCHYGCTSGRDYGTLGCSTGAAAGTAGCTIGYQGTLDGCAHEKDACYAMCP